MKRIVFCWELGGNYGHITGFIALQRRLQLQGIEVFFILRNLRYSGLLDPQAHGRCLQAPRPRIVVQEREAWSYADMLAQLGYDDEHVLHDYLAAWRALLLDLQPDLVLVDHAPTALLAAHSLGSPAAALGTGFVNPPAGAEFPLYSPLRPAPQPRIDHALLPVINRVLHGFGAAPLGELGDLLRRGPVFLGTLPELDHYGPRADAEYWGPLFSADIGDRVQWPRAAQTRIFAYLTPRMANLPLVLDALVQLPGHKAVHIGGLAGDEIQRYQRSDITVLPAPVQMGPLLSEVDLVITQGGMGVSSQCFLAGVRQVVIPTQMEQRMLARRLVQQGLAYAIDPQQERPPYLALFERALACPQLGQRSSAMQQRYAGFVQEEQIEALTEALVELMP